MVEENARASKHIVGLAVVSGDFEGEDLGATVGRAGVEGRQLGLRHVSNLAVLFGGAGLVEATVRGMLANGLKAAKRTKTGDVSGHHGRAPRFRDKGHGAEVVEFIGLGLRNGVVNGVLVGQIAVEEVELVVAHQVVDEAATRGGLGNTSH